MNEWDEFRHFLYLLTILECGGIRPAAEILHTSSPNLCTQAKGFQEYFNIRLYEKGADNRLSPTRAGTALAPMARGLLQARDEVIAALIAIGEGEIPTLRLGCGTLVAEGLFRTACEIHKEFLPDCVIRPAHADTVQLVSDIVSGKIDAAIATLPIEHPELCVEEVRRDRLVVCLRADHPFSGKQPLSPRIFRGISGFSITRSTILKPMHGSWNYWPRPASKSTGFPALLTRRKCSGSCVTDTA